MFLKQSLQEKIHYWVMILFVLNDGLQDRDFKIFLPTLIIGENTKLLGFFFTPKQD